MFACASRDMVVPFLGFLLKSIGFVSLAFSHLLEIGLSRRGKDDFLLHLFEQQRGGREHAVLRLRVRNPVFVANCD